MPNIHDVFKDDEVSGTIIGGNFVCGALCYNGRKQGKDLWASSEAELKQKVESLKEELCHENAEILPYLWPDANLWSIKIF